MVGAAPKRWQPGSTGLGAQQELLQSRGDRVALTRAERLEEGLVGGEYGVETALEPHRAGDYPNFVEEPADASAFFDPETWRRLRDVKALYDPDDLFRGNHHIPPADAALARVAAG